jgi:hypothetical protein
MIKLKTFQKLTFYEKYFDNPVHGIPKESGIYYWVYWPQINNKMSISDIEKKLLEYTKNGLIFSEKIRGTYKFEGVISEQWYKDNGNIFGLAEAKKNRLINYLKADLKNLDFFIIFFERICFSRPFYIGKANNLRTRLVSQHFKGKTEIMSQISSFSIPRNDIYVGYEIIKDSASDKVNVILEEIFSRNVKPGITKKPN